MNQFLFSAKIMSLCQIVSPPPPQNPNSVYPETTNLLDEYLMYNLQILYILLL